MGAQIQPATNAAATLEVQARATSQAQAQRLAEKQERSDAAKQPKPSERAAERSEVTQALERIQRFVQPMANELEFSVDEVSGVRVVKVIDKVTQELIRQIPSAEVLEIAKALDRLQGILLKQKA
jgi:flagellar protein FlaG